MRLQHLRSNLLLKHWTAYLPEVNVSQVIPRPPSIDDNISRLKLSSSQIKTSFVQSSVQSFDKPLFLIILSSLWYNIANSPKLGFKLDIAGLIWKSSADYYINLVDLLLIIFLKKFFLKFDKSSLLRKPITRPFPFIEAKFFRS